MTPGGIRLGTPAITTRGFTTADMPAVADFLDRGVRIAVKVKEDSLAANPKAKLRDFIAAMGSVESIQAMKALKEDIEVFSSKYPTIGFERGDMRYPL